MGIKTIQARVEHEIFYQEMLALFRKHAEANHLTKEDMLALSASITGRFLAMQDRSTMTPERGLALIAENIESGNAIVLESLLGSMEGSS